MSVKFGIAIPQFYPEGTVDLAVLDEYLAAAEALDYHSGWVQEEILRSPALDAIGLLTYAAARTTRLVLGTAVLITPVRNPLHLAKELLTLDHLSKGRLIVGVGLGTYTTTYPAFGIPAELRARRFAEGIRVMKKLWTGDSVMFDGDYHKFTGRAHAAQAVPEAASADLFRRQCGGRAQAHRQDGRRLGRRPHPGVGVQEARRRAAPDGGRRRPRSREVFDRQARLRAVDNQKGRAEERVMKWFGDTYGDPEGAKKSVTYGTEQECVDKIAEFIEAGAQELILNPIFEQREQMDLLAKAIIPKL